VGPCSPPDVPDGLGVAESSPPPGPLSSVSVGDGVASGVAVGDGVRDAPPDPLEEPPPPLDPP
jgi:hypothetical protein